MLDLLKDRTAVTEAFWRELRERLPACSERYLRNIVRQSGLALAPLVEGVRQDSLDDLERTLLALEREYSAAPDLARQKACRTAVIAGKDHARWAIRRAAAPEKKALKEEMVLWMLTWLENPPLFPQWARLRRRELAPEIGLV